MLRTAGVVALALLIAASAEAQELAGTFDQLRVLVKPGDTLTITDNVGRFIRGKLEGLTPSSLVLNVSGASREFQSVDVNTIEKRGPDSLKNGALIGMAVGGGLAALAIAATGFSGSEAGYVATGALIYSGIGAGIGAGIDALIEGRRVIYAGPASPATTLTVTPLLTGRRKGVLLSVRLTR